jgi:hypothetical protein
MIKEPTKFVPYRIGVVRATRAENDEQLLQSWLKSLSRPREKVTPPDPTASANRCCKMFANCPFPI